MWILPKQLISAFAPGTEALTSDSGACSQACAQSLIQRSKPSQSKTYLRAWKAGNWTRLRSGAICEPSLGASFLDWWTSYLAGSRASHFPVPASEPETKTQDTSSLTFWRELDNADLPLFSLKMLKELSPASSLETTGTTQQERPFCSMSSGSWSVWVTRQRQAYSARLNAARLISESGSSSSLPTPTAMEYKDVGEAFLLARIDKGGRVARRLATLNLQPLIGRVKVRVGLLEQMMGVPIGWTECAFLATE